MTKFLLALVLLLAFGAPVSAVEYTWTYHFNKKYSYNFVFPKELLRLVKAFKDGSGGYYQSPDKLVSASVFGYDAPPDFETGWQKAHGHTWTRSHPGCKIQRSAKYDGYWYVLEGTTEIRGERFYEVHAHRPAGWTALSLTFPAERQPVLMRAIRKMTAGIVGQLDDL